MSTTTPAPTYFHTQRDLLVAEVALSLEHVLQNINKLNRNLEQVIAVGHEFSSVEALWSQFENVMGNRDAEESARDGAQEGGSSGEEEEETEVGEKGGK